MPPVALALWTTALLVLLGGRALLGTSKSLSSRFLRVITWVIFAILAVSGVALAALASSDSLRAQAFALLCTKLAKEPEMTPVRCDELGLRNVTGDVIEFGPGPGTNFKCWGDVAGPSSWVGVEPNTNFESAQNLEAEAFNLTFSRRTVWLRGEDVDVPAGSFDVAVLTHVLCSVSDPAAVLAQAARALKPGGKMYVMEHVAAVEGTTGRSVQQLLSPLFQIVANGCQFRHLAAEVAGAAGFEPFEVVDFLAPIPIPPFKPHIRAVATKSA